MQSYIGYALDEQVRYQATSGGIGSALLKYLFDQKIIKSAISFNFNSMTLEYEPKLIYNYNNYKISSSIYHEIKLIHFIKKNIDNIRGDFFCFALPCQIEAIRYLLQKKNIHSYIVGLTCSSQQSLDATKYLLRRLSIPLSNVKSIRYRGFGWPSGITIIKNDEEKKFCPNNNSIWTDIFHSRLFIQKRCFQCIDTISSQSDISLADPWLEEYILNERKGQTLVLCNTIESVNLLRNAEELGYLHLESCEYTLIKNSQINTEIRKEKYKRHKKLVRLLQKIFHKSLYRYIVLKFSLCFKLHCIALHKIEKIV